MIWASIILLALLQLIMAVCITTLRDKPKRPTLAIYKLAYKQKISISDNYGCPQDTITLEGNGRMVGDSAEDAIKRYQVLNPRSIILTVQLESPRLHSDTDEHCTGQGKRCHRAGLTPGPHPR